MTERVAGFHLSTQRSLALGRQVQVKNNPAGALVAVAIEVQSELAGIDPGDYAIGDGGSPQVGAQAAASDRWWGEIDGSQRVSGTPGGVWSPGKSPDLAGFKGQVKGRLR
jgi:hypothetical protein